MTSETAAISVRGLSHAYGEHIVLGEISLQVLPGEFYGFLGQNGAGKSTAIRALCGFLQPQQGEIVVAGVDVVRNPVEIRRQIGVVSDDVELYDRLTAMEFLEFAGQMHGLSLAESRARSTDLLTRLDLLGDSTRPIMGYSLGMRKKTAFAAALIHAPKVLFLDEPFNGLDVLTVRTLCHLLKWLTTERKVTVFFTSHGLDMAERLCDRIAVLHGGSIVREGTIAELREDAEEHGASLEEIFLSLTGARAQADAALAWYGSGASLGV
jgi:ABC-2 type transport system ATP-binding protein